MPLHDWTRVDGGIFHAFHVTWIPEIQKVLNSGLLPEGYYALAEQHAGRAIADEPATLASYAAGPAVEIYVEHVAFGAPLPETALFLRPDRYVNVPLEPTYQAAYGGMPAFWRGVLEHGPAIP